MSDFLVRVLRRNLRQQSTSGYVLAEVRRAEVGYTDVGEFVWIIGVRKERPSSAREVIWVSTDFYIYENAATDFRIPKTVDPPPFTAEGWPANPALQSDGRVGRYAPSRVRR